MEPKLTTASLLRAGSFARGLFCFDKLPEFRNDPGILRRELSAEDVPPGWPSSPEEIKGRRCCSYEITRDNPFTTSLTQWPIFDFRQSRQTPPPQKKGKRKEKKRGRSKSMT